MGADSNTSAAGCGFMVTFAPSFITDGLPPAIEELEDVTMSLGSTLSFTANAVQGSTPITWSVFSGPSNVTIASSTGQFTWTPLSMGDFLLVIKASNSFGSSTEGFAAAITAASSTTTVSGSTVTVGNTAPVITNLSSATTVYAEQPISFILTAVDQDGDTVTFNMESDAPAGASLNQSTGQFVWIPTAEQGPGTYPIVFIASDGQNESRSTMTAVVLDIPWTRNRGLPTNSFRRI